jgi:peptidoglycan/xylan/chitin deacetylase (PgdA/CDA1 family)
MKAQCRALILGWDQLRQLVADPLVTVGAHSRRHYALSGLPFAEARAEIESSVRRVERELGRPCRHFSFPFGDAASAGEREFAMVRELGLKTAVTTRRGLIHAWHRAELAGLPRVSLDGDYQQARYVKVLLSGVPFAVSNMMRRVSPQAAAAL